MNTTGNQEPSWKAQSGAHGSSPCCAIHMIPKVAPRTVNPIALAASNLSVGDLSRALRLEPSGVWRMSENTSQSESARRTRATRIVIGGRMLRSLCAGSSTSPQFIAGLRTKSAVRLQAAEPYLMSVSILNIGRYIEITMVPTMMPTPIIRIGSMIDVSDLMPESTSSS